MPLRQRRKLDYASIKDRLCARSTKKGTSGLLFMLWDPVILPGHSPHGHSPVQRGNVQMLHTQRHVFRPNLSEKVLPTRGYVESLFCCKRAQFANIASKDVQSIKHHVTKLRVLI